MNGLLKPLIFVWRVWFYVAILIAILLLFPFIFITSLRPAWYRSFFMFARAWAWMVLILTGFWPRIVWHQKPDPKGQYIIAPNHTSMIDIMLTLAIFPNCFLFIGKKELAKMPLFGYFYKRTNLLVDRSSMRSRAQVFEQAADKIDEGYGLCIFPEGMVPKEENIVLGNFKNGAFKLAIDKNIPLIPVTYKDCKRRMPFSWTRGYPGILRVEVHPFLNMPNHSDQSAETLKMQCYDVIFGTLTQQAQQTIIV
jgi:1-acyl-sn-glycerol-3-phosphate acyltransferase